MSSADQVRSRLWTRFLMGRVVVREMGTERRFLVKRILLFIRLALASGEVNPHRERCPARVVARLRLLRVVRPATVNPVPRVVEPGPKRWIAELALAKVPWQNRALFLSNEILALNEIENASRVLIAWSQSAKYRLYVSSALELLRRVNPV